ncbi:hypothetical protein [Streptomyces sp. MH13]|uniref:hypothetical protein n=1 Tax=unclassified Streptomyces TaxID=2593676 RepID=UPI003CE94314
MSDRTADPATVRAPGPAAVRTGAPGPECAGILVRALRVLDGERRTARVSRRPRSGS